MEYEQLVGPQWQLRVRAAFIVAELDFEYAGRERFDDGADLAAAKAARGEVFSEGDDVEQLDGVGRWRHTAPSTGT